MPKRAGSASPRGAGHDRGDPVPELRKYGTFPLRGGAYLATLNKVRCRGSLVDLPSLPLRLTERPALVRARACIEARAPYCAADARA